jgi:uncharacterized protein YabN with tetrapyrrole methylase and pyrophosphatase domain
VENLLMPGRDPCLTLNELLTTMRALRAPGGCPWDAEQTPESLAPYILEEACETIEAIEAGEPARIADELGDLLLQVVFQADIFAQRGLFDFADVAAGINAKLRRRHPHVFAATASHTSSAELARQWERLKQSEQAAHSLPSHPLGQPPRTLPALQRAQKLVSKAWRSDWTSTHLPSRPTESPAISKEQLGQSLLHLVQQAEAGGIDAEQALRDLIQKILLASGPAQVNPVTGEEGAGT